MTKPRERPRHPNIAQTTVQHQIRKATRHAQRRCKNLATLEVLRAR